jgi:ParB-like chromosome segregation protein Spo0J
MKFTVHPLAEKFPDLPADEFGSLIESIRTIGLLEPIVVNSSSQILDGRHRYKACQELRIAPHTVLWTTMARNSGITEAQFIFAANFHRRHLTDDQRVMIVAAFLPLIKEETSAAKTAGRSAGGKRRSLNLNSGSSCRDPKKMHADSAAGKLAERADVSRYKAEQVIAVEESAPDLADKVRAGKVSLKEAVKAVKEKATGNQPRIALGPGIILIRFDRFLRKFHEGDQTDVKRVIFNYLVLENWQKKLNASEKPMIKPTRLPLSGDLQKLLG